MNQNTAIDYLIWDTESAQSSYNFLFCVSRLFTEKYAVVLVRSGKASAWTGLQGWADVSSLKCINTL